MRNSAPYKPFLNEVNRTTGKMLRLHNMVNGYAKYQDMYYIICEIKGGILKISAEHFHDYISNTFDARMIELLKSPNHIPQQLAALKFIDNERKNYDLFQRATTLDIIENSFKIIGTI